LFSSQNNLSGTLPATPELPYFAGKQPIKAMVTLENDSLRVSVRSKGAELTSLFDKSAGIEYLWQGNPEIWNWHAPNLFPVVGACFNQQIRVDGQLYPMERHGFARQSAFSLQESSPTQAILSLESSPRTLAIYPYRFRFQLIYSLNEQSLEVTYRVINADNQPVFFSVGGHPAFNVPFFPDEQYADYYLEFAHEEPLARHLISERGLFTGQTRPVPTEGRKLHLSKEMFAEDALVFKNISSRQVSLRSRNHSHHLRVDYPAFNYLGLWAKPGAPFVCIEPWLGCADTEGKPVIFPEKEAIQRVDPGAVFEGSFFIRVFS
jgi:galactose mutarotase-like enzyme